MNYILVFSVYILCMRLRPIKGISDTVFLQIWCSKQRDNALKLALEEDPHSPDMFR